MLYLIVHYLVQFVENKRILHLVCKDWHNALYRNDKHIWESLLKYPGRWTYLKVRKAIRDGNINLIYSLKNEFTGFLPFTWSHNCIAEVFQKQYHETSDFLIRFNARYIGRLISRNLRLKKLQSAWILNLEVLDRFLNYDTAIVIICISLRFLINSTNPRFWLDSNIKKIMHWKDIDITPYENLLSKTGDPAPFILLEKALKCCQSENIASYIFSNAYQKGSYTIDQLFRLAIYTGKFWFDAIIAKLIDKWNLLSLDDKDYIRDKYFSTTNDNHTLIIHFGYTNQYYILEDNILSHVSYVRTRKMINKISTLDDKYNTLNNLLMFMIMNHYLYDQ